MNHQFEVVLVSCDSTDESYTTHAQMTAWPAYPRGDFRISLLKTHFKVTKCPRLIILDANGVCVTAEGVAMLEKDPHGRLFPWCERPIETLFSSSVDGELQQVLSRLELPPHNGNDARDAKIVCLLFCELWCPNSRDLIRRIKFLGEKMHRCAGPEGKCSFNIYHIHNDNMEKYAHFDFLEDLPFVSVCLQDEELRKAVFHFFGVHQQYPSFCITCPSEDWVVRNGVDEIQRDPTGVCFPWRPLPRQNEPLSYVDILKPVHEDDLVDHLCRGPVFIALMHQVHALKDEAMSNVRAAAVSYLNLGDTHQRSSTSGSAAGEPESDDKDEYREEVDRASIGGVIDEEHGLSSIHDLTQINNETFTKLRTLLSCPPSVQAESTMDSLHRQDTLDSPLSPKIGEQTSGHFGGTTSHGNAPWNAPLNNPNSGRVQFPFLYTISNSRVAAILNKFCNFDEKTVRQHQTWLKHQMKIQKEKRRAAMERHLRLEGLEMMSRRASVGNANNRHSQLSHAEQRDTEVGDEPKVDAARSRSPYLPNFEFEEEDSDESDEENEDENEYRRKLAVTDDMMLGDGQFSTGCGVIVDLACGTYYICGSLTESTVILHFLDRWERGKLLPLEIRVPNSEELLDEPMDMNLHNQPSRRLQKVRTRRFAVPQNLPDNTPRCMPGVVIWLPTKEHAKAGMASDVIYRALLKHAYHKCPTDDDAVQAATLGRCRHDPDDVALGNGRIFGRLERLVQKITKFWIFGLEDGGDNSGVSSSDNWEGPGSEFLAELRGLVERNIQQEQAKLAAQKKVASEQDSENSSSVSGHVQFDEDDDTPGNGRGSKKGDLFLPWETPGSVFEAGFDKLRKMHVEGSEPAQVIGNHSICMYTSKSKQDLYSAIIDELSYYTVVQSPPPPLFVLVCGNLPAAAEVPWPTVLLGSHVHVIGSVPGLSSYRELVSPTVSVLEWASWLENYADDHITAKIGRHVQVPWS
eukprot:gnl/MRDRNA2_/MRDRNA2_109534_c0_seq1.p1 gnl/MRDRNA2_/MRDRNA2_109534_c0~~gnl/MRDRNA2_/MRDRNA2_109534_c0_seq1.p1  ORF type:complete len:989 (-),score=166.24 gnl/MRDRNA2_/MRDRNA2_109534_c0_seq1:23-2938(-)